MPPLQKFHRLLPQRLLKTHFAPNPENLIEKIYLSCWKHMNKYCIMYRKGWIYSLLQNLQIQTSPLEMIDSLSCLLMPRQGGWYHFLHLPSHWNISAPSQIFSQTQYLFWPFFESGEELWKVSKLSRNWSGNLPFGVHVHLFLLVPMKFSSKSTFLARIAPARDSKLSQWESKSSGQWVYRSYIPHPIWYLQHSLLRINQATYHCQQYCFGFQFPH